MVGGDDHRAARRDVLAPDPLHPEVDVEERLQDRPREPVDERVDAALARARQEDAAIHATDTRRGGGRYSARRMAIDRARTIRGALAGAVAAGVWAAQQPLDKRVFGVDYDDTELLGKAVTRGRGVAGRRAGACTSPTARSFGAAYAAVAPRLAAAVVGPRPGRRAGRAPRDLAADDRRRPRPPGARRLPRAVGELARLRAGDLAPPALRLVLGELERRLNAPEDPEVPSYEHVVSSNGHGNLEHAAIVPGPEEPDAP